MQKVSAKTQALFKKAYHHNWDNGTKALQAILKDPNCDRATALMIFWMGSPAYYYNHSTPATMAAYEVQQFEFLKGIAKDLLADKYPVGITYTVDPALLPAELGQIPAALAEPVVGAIPYRDVLYPNSNPFQDEVLALCQHCPQVADMYALAAQGADFSKKILNGYALPIVVALNYGQVEAVRYFIETGHDLNQKDNKNPLLFNAVFAKNLALVQLLVDHGVEVNAKGQYGKTVLHALAEMAGRPEYWNPEMEAIVTLLCSRGLSPLTRNTDKRTASEVARALGHHACADFLDGLPAA